MTSSFVHAQAKVRPKKEQTPQSLGGNFRTPNRSRALPTVGQERSAAPLKNKVPDEICERVQPVEACMDGISAPKNKAQKTVSISKAFIADADSLAWQPPSRYPKRECSAMLWSGRPSPPTASRKRSIDLVYISRVLRRRASRAVRTERRIRRPGASPRAMEARAVTRSWLCVPPTAAPISAAPRARLRCHC